VTTKPTEPTGRVERAARLKWCPIAKMRVSPTAQRELKQHRVDHLVANFDLEQIGTPVVSERDGAYYILDGQHRIEALRGIGWGDQQIQCWTYTGLTEEDEAERFLKLNDTLVVDSFSKFRVGVNAGRAAGTGRSTAPTRPTRRCWSCVTARSSPRCIRPPTGRTPPRARKPTTATTRTRTTRTSGTRTTRTSGTSTTPTTRCTTRCTRTASDEPPSHPQIPGVHPP